MESWHRHTPHFSLSQAAGILEGVFGVTGHLQPLPSERDQNFLVTGEEQPKFVLKIANGGETLAVLQAQNAVLNHLACCNLRFNHPRLCLTRAGHEIDEVNGDDGIRYPVRLLTYVPGELLAHLRPHPPETLEALGSFFGQLDRALHGFAHPALVRKIEWDVREAPEVVSKHSCHIPDHDRRALLAWWQGRWDSELLSKLARLRMSLIHNDGNDDNVLVTDPDTHGGTISGIIDFGDAIHTYTASELAITAAYAIFDSCDPLYAASSVVRGYHRVLPLSELEVALLYDLIGMRLCLSVTIAAFRQTMERENAYLTVSEAPAWHTLDRLAHIHPRLAQYTFRDACGLPACPQAPIVMEWLHAHRNTFAAVVPSQPKEQGSSLVFDLRPGSSQWPQMVDRADTEAGTRAIRERLEHAGVQMGLGRYGEPRLCYTSSLFRGHASEVEGWRTVHLGVDIFQDAGSPVFAPYEAILWSAQNNLAPQDYGPTLILRHSTDDGTEWFTLYGHLSVESLKTWSPGQRIQKGERLGTIGSPHENGGWPPHVHVQIILDHLDCAGNFPGTCSPWNRSVWKTICPDPNVILGFAELMPATSRRPVEEMLQIRSRVIGRSVRVSYVRPLHLVQGWRASVFDEWGREYVDAANNVCHVGHGHPRVVEAAARQMGLITTNTRYLHEHLLAYAERLCATLPEPLRVCYFVCSGSEANELALRLARAYTGGSDMIVVEGGYHGNTSTLIGLSPYKFNGPGGAGPSRGVHTVNLPDVYRGPYRDPATAGRFYAEEVVQVVHALKTPTRQLCAFLCESLLSCGGQIVLPPGYLETVYQTVRKAGGVCIADEVQVGFGRLGTQFWGFQLSGVIPDIVTMGKPIGNGFPMGAVVTTPAIARAFEQTGMEYFNTFGGNPVSCAVGMAVLDVIEQEDLQRHAHHMGLYLHAQLTKLKEQFPIIGDVRGAGLFIGVELVCHPETRAPAPRVAGYMVERLKAYGVLLSADGVYQNVLKIKPPLVLTEREADWMVAAFEHILREPRIQWLASRDSCSHPVGTPAFSPVPPPG